MMNRYMAIALSIFFIISGALSLSLALYLRTRVPGHVSVFRRLVRGLISVFLGCLSLLLLRRGSINPMVAFLLLSVPSLISEYALVAREKRQLIRLGLYDPAASQAIEKNRFEKIVAKGKTRYVWRSFATYGAGGLLLVVWLYFEVPELPIYMWIVTPLFTGWCGTALALDKWKRQTPQQPSRKGSG